MANIVSYSLWGNQDFYYDGAFENIDLVKEYYPGFIPRFYCSPSIPDKWYNKYTDNGAEVIIVEDGTDDWRGLFWRFYVLQEDGIVLVRDTDSRISNIEKDAVNEWLNSKYQFHSMRCHIEHNVPILGGMFGARNCILKNIKSLIKKWGPKDKKGNDQDFLQNIIWPKVRKQTLAHDRYPSGIKFSKDYEYHPQKFFMAHKVLPFSHEITDENFVGKIIK